MITPPLTDRERELVEALRPFAAAVGYACTADQSPNDSIECNVGPFQRAAQALASVEQGKGEPSAPESGRVAFEDDATLLADLGGIASTHPSVTYPSQVSARQVREVVRRAFQELQITRAQRDALRANRQSSVEQGREGPHDDPQFDATDAAHPAWWRGHDHTTLVFCQKINDILDGKDDGNGFNYEPWGALRKRLLALPTPKSGVGPTHAESGGSPPAAAKSDSHNHSEGEKS